MAELARVGAGLCTHRAPTPQLGVRVYDGTGDNEGTMQQRMDRCAAACLDKRAPLQFGPWSLRADAVGFAFKTDGRCYCQHEEWASCNRWATSSYAAYEFKGEALANGTLATFLPPDAPLVELLACLGVVPR